MDARRPRRRPSRSARLRSSSMAVTRAASASTSRSARRRAAAAGLALLVAVVAACSDDATEGGDRSSPHEPRPAPRAVRATPRPVRTTPASSSSRWPTAGGWSSGTRRRRWRRAADVELRHRQPALARAAGEGRRRPADRSTESTRTRAPRRRPAARSRWCCSATAMPGSPSSRSTSRPTWPAGGSWSWRRTTSSGLSTACSARRRRTWPRRATDVQVLSQTLDVGDRRERPRRLAAARARRTPSEVAVIGHSAGAEAAYDMAVADRPRSRASSPTRSGLGGDRAASRPRSPAEVPGMVMAGHRPTASSRSPRTARCTEA